MRSNRRQSWHWRSRHKTEQTTEKVGIALDFGRRRASRRGEAGRLCFFSSNLAGCSLARIVEEELIAVGIIDHQKPVAPRTLLDRNALGLEFRAQRVQRGDRGLARRRLDVQ